MLGVIDMPCRFISLLMQVLVSNHCKMIRVTVLNHGILIRDSILKKVERFYFDFTVPVDDVISEMHLENVPRIVEIKNPEFVGFPAFLLQDNPNRFLHLMYLWL